MFDLSPPPNMNRNTGNPEQKLRQFSKIKPRKERSQMHTSFFEDAPNWTLVTFFTDQIYVYTSTAIHKKSQEKSSLWKRFFYKQQQVFIEPG